MILMVYPCYVTETLQLDMKVARFTLGLRTRYEEVFGGRRVSETSESEVGSKNRPTRQSFDTLDLFYSMGQS
jgi:hypothetical protein